MGGDDGFGNVVAAVTSYRWRGLLVGAKDHNVLAPGWFRAPVKFSDLFDAVERRVQ
jgi:hypothetical protein